MRIACQGEEGKDETHSAQNVGCKGMHVNEPMITACPPVRVSLPFTCSIVVDVWETEVMLGKRQQVQIQLSSAVLTLFAFY